MAQNGGLLENFSGISVIQNCMKLQQTVYSLMSGQRRKDRRTDGPLFSVSNTFLSSKET